MEIIYHLFTSIDLSSFCIAWGLLAVYIELSGKKVDKTTELEAQPSFAELFFEIYPHFFHSLPLPQDKLKAMNLDRATECLGKDQLGGLRIQPMTLWFMIDLLNRSKSSLRMTKELGTKRVDMENLYKKLLQHQMDTMSADTPPSRTGQCHVFSL